MSSSKDHQTLLSLVEVASQHMLRKEWNEAASRYRRAAEWSIDSPFIHRYLAYAYMMCGNYEDAVLEYKKQVQHDPSDSDAHHGLGASLVRMYKCSENKDQNLLDEAHDEIEMAVRLNSRDPEKLSALSHVLFLQGNLKGAYSHIMRAVSVQPYNQSFLNDLVVITKKLGNLREAIKSIEEATKMAPRSDGPFYVLGFLLDVAGDKVNAKVAFQEALLRYPRSVQTHEALDRLRASS
jgi:Flp pilus assembly protein TadD